MSGWLNTPNLQMLEKGLDATSLRHRVLSHNVANVDTPDYKRSDVDFSAIFADATGDGLTLKKTSPRHLDGVMSSANKAVVTDNSTTIRNDGNNVSIEQEMTWLAENSIQYNSIARAITSELGKLRTVIQSK